MTLGRDLTVACMFLTRLPIRPSTSWKDDDLPSSVVMFPIVGALIGLIGGLGFALASSLGLPPFLAAIIAIASMILATGALHEDGLADVADGFGGGQTKADKLRIMRDSRLGTYGTLALVIALLIRISAVVALEDLWMVVPALITAAALSRAAMPVAMTVMAPARDEGLAAKAGRPHRGRVVLAAVIAALLACLCVPWVQVFFVLVAASTVTAAFMLLVKRQIDGVTGDTIGALQQIVEIAILVTLVSQKSLV